MSQLYAKKPANWLEWDQAQVARVKCIAEWKSKKASLDHAGKLALLKELLVLLFHTVMPPDRVGIGESRLPPPTTPAYPIPLFLVCSSQAQVGSDAEKGCTRGLPA